MYIVPIHTNAIFILFEGEFCNKKNVPILYYNDTIGIYTDFYVFRF